MKKLSAIVLVFLLLVSTIGVTVSKHYCGSVLIETSLMPQIADACDADMPMDADACKDDHQHFSVDSPLVLLSFSFDLTPSVEWLDLASIKCNKELFDNSPTTKILAEIFPPPPGPNIYTKVQSFLL